MKHHLIALFVFFGLVSCSTEVMLYEDYKDVPVIYGIIDAQADTNFIKITKAFCSDNDDPVNPFAASLVYDSSNYPGKLDAFIVELKSDHNQPFQPTGRLLVLDTVTIHHKEPGIFYYPHQKLYYTTERFNVNSGGEKYRYRLCVVTPEQDTVTSETGVVGGDIVIGTSKLNFQSEPSDATLSLLFTSTEEAVAYEIGMKFYYREVHEGQPMVKKYVSWSYGLKPIDAYEYVSGKYHKQYYSVNTLFKEMEEAIADDTVWDVNHPEVTRYMDDFVVTISAAGSDLHIYYQYTQATQNGLTLSSDYTNVDGGWGLFSSRIFVERKAKLSAKTKYDLFCKSWGFREE